MTQKGTRAKLVNWAARAAFLASVLALLGTSKPKGWELQGLITGPKTAPADRGLEVTIESGGEPRSDVRLHGHDFPQPFSGTELPCAATWPVPAKKTCFVPPGATFDGLDVEGSCGGCSGGCPPPPGAFLKATTSAVPAWKDTASTKMTTTLPSHPQGMIASQLVARMIGARFYTAKLSVVEKTVGVLFSQEEACGFEPNGHASCYFLVFDDKVKGQGDVEVTVDVTGWGTDCKGGAGAASCVAPGTLKIEGLELGK